MHEDETKDDETHHKSNNERQQQDQRKLKVKQLSSCDGKSMFICLPIFIHINKQKQHKMLLKFKYNNLNSYIVRVFSSSTRNFIGVLAKFIQDALCIIRQYMHGWVGLSYILLFTAF